MASYHWASHEAVTILLLLLWENSDVFCKSLPSRSSGNGLHYAYLREFLLALQDRGDSLPSRLPMDVRRKPPAGSKQGRRGRCKGVRQRLRRRGNKPPLPAVIMSNISSLPCKMDEWLNSRHCHEYRESSTMVVTEIWLRPDIPDSLIQIEGFSCVRADRTASSGTTVY